VAWNTRRALFSDPEVRRALTLAIDRQAIIDATYGNRYARVAYSPVVSHCWAANRELKPLPYDPQQAREILARKGFTDSNGDGVLERDGKPFAFTLLTNTGNKLREDAVTIIQAQLKKVGIEARPQLLAFNTMNERTDRADFDAVLVRWSMPTDLDLSFAFSSKADGASGNVFGYASPEMDQLLEAALAQTTLEGLAEKVHAVEALVHRDQPATYLYESQDLMAVSRRLRDIKANELERLWHLWDWWLAPAS
jgi:peptide/nickel transport system substrate-binding protein